MVKQSVELIKEIKSVKIYLKSGQYFIAAPFLSQTATSTWSINDPLKLLYIKNKIAHGRRMPSGLTEKRSKGVDGGVGYLTLTP